jgi:hypothetical protein
MDIKTTGTAPLATTVTSQQNGSAVVTPLTSGGKDQPDPPVVKNVLADDVVTLSSGTAAEEKSLTYSATTLTSGGKDQPDPPK